MVNDLNGGEEFSVSRQFLTVSLWHDQPITALRSRVSSEETDASRRQYIDTDVPLHVGCEPDCKGKMALFATRTLLDMRSCFSRQHLCACFEWSGRKSIISLDFNPQHRAGHNVVFVDLPFSKSSSCFFPVLCPQILTVACFAQNLQCFCFCCFVFLSSVLSGERQKHNIKAKIYVTFWLSYGPESKNE